MKLHLIFFIGILQAINIEAQTITFNIDSLNEADYRKFFPLLIQDVRKIPTNDVVCILPTNEKDKKLQKEVNEYYLKTFIYKLYFMLPSQNSKVITDKEALKQDLSNVNIRTFGTVSGNLWTRWFLENTKDFPIKIYNDSIVTDTVYRGSNYMVSAIWFNPINYKRSVIINTPQYQEYAKFEEGRELSQYCIFQNQKVVTKGYYCQLKGSPISYDKDISTPFNYISDHWNDHFDYIDKNLYRYPSQQQLSTCLISENEITYETIPLADKIENLDDTKDMEWLVPIAKKNKVIALGENHHFVYNSFIARKILFAINTYSYFPLLVLELPYSYAGYLNHYISLTDDVAANAFRNEILKKFLIPKLSTFDDLRRWNKIHPDKKIHAGCSDLEQDFIQTIYVILNPYLQKIDPHVDLKIKKDSVQTYFSRAEKLMEVAKKQNLVGEYSFQTPQYMESVLENLKTSIPIKTDPKNFNDHTQRFRVMIRNVTDDRFLGKQIARGKAMFWGGAEHFRTLNNIIPEYNASINTEGYYLAHNYTPTKGKVYSIRLNTLACSIRDSFRRIDPRLRVKSEETLIDLFYKRKIKLMEPVIDKYTSEIDEYIYKLSYQHPGHAIRIKNINLENIYKLNYEGFSRYDILKDVKDISDFNTTIFIPFAPIGDN